MSALIDPETYVEALLPAPEAPETVTCMKCHGTGKYEYTMGHTRGQVGNCTRCTPGTGQMSGKDIARYWGWLTHGRGGQTSRRLIIEHMGLKSHRDLTRDALVFAHQEDAETGDFFWGPIPVDALYAGELVLIPEIKTGELLVCVVVDVQIK